MCSAVRCAFVLCDLVSAVAILSAASAAQDVEDCTSFSERSSPPNEVFGLYCVCILAHCFQPDFGYFPSSKVWGVIVCALRYAVLWFCALSQCCTIVPAGVGVQG